MRIVYLHQYFNLPSMSGSTRSYEFGRRLAEAGHDVHILTSSRDGRTSRGWRTQAVHAGLTVHWRDIPYSNKMAYRRRMVAFATYALTAGRQAARLRADVIVATSTPLTVILPAVRASAFSGTPIVLEVRDLWPELPIAVGALKGRASRWIAHQLERFAYWKADTIIALSPGMAEGVERVSKGRRPLHIVPNSCDIATFKLDSDHRYLLRQAFREARPWMRDRDVGLYFGTVGVINDLERLVKLAKLLDLSGSKFGILVVGDGADLSRIKALAQEVGILDRVIYFEPPVPKEQAPKFFAGTDFALSIFDDIPAMWTNSANKFFDALAAGTPIVINYRGWQADLIKKHGLGVVVSPDPTMADAEAVIAMLDRRESIIRSCHDIAREKFSRDSLFQDFEKAIKQAASIRSYRLRKLRRP